jgi:hypothetical protein
MKKFLFLALILNASCRATYSPAIYFSNSSSGEIKNIYYSVNNQDVIHLEKLASGKTELSRFEINEVPDFFGNIMLRWTPSGKVDEVSRSFKLSKHNLPSFDSLDSAVGNLPPYLEIFITDDDFFIVSRDMPDSEAMGKKIAKLLKPK